MLIETINLDGREVILDTVAGIVLTNQMPDLWELAMTFGVARPIQIRNEAAEQLIQALRSAQETPAIEVVADLAKCVGRLERDR